MSGALKHCPRTTLSWSWMSNALLEPMRRGLVEILEPPEVVTQNCLTGEHVSKVCAFWKSALPLLHARDVLDKRFTYFCATLLLCSLHRAGGCVVRICNYSPRRPIVHRALHFLQISARTRSRTRSDRTSRPPYHCATCPRDCVLSRGESGPGQRRRRRPSHRMEECCRRGFSSSNKATPSA